MDFLNISISQLQNVLLGATVIVFLGAIIYLIDGILRGDCDE